MPATARKTHKKFDGPVTEYNGKYLRCRGRHNHPWKQSTDFINIATKKYRGQERIIAFTEVLSCALCKSKRFDPYTVTKDGRFDKGNSYYDYAPGYELKRGGSIPLDQARDELIMRELAEKLEANLFARLAGMRNEVRDTVSRPRLRVVGE